MMDSNHDIVPTLRMMDGVYTRLAADEIERLRVRVAVLERRSDTSLIPGAVPTHRCKVCGAYWRKWNVDGETSWNLCSPGCGECCDNAAMSDQIEALTSPAKVGTVAQVTPEEQAEINAALDLDDELACSSCGLTMAQSRALTAAKMGGDEREALKHPLERYVGLVIELLEDARSILLRGWAHGATARDDKGSPVSANCVNVACAWSLLGALDVAGVNLAKRLTDGKTFGEADATRHSVNNIAYQIATELVADETDLCAGYPAQRLDQWNNNSSRTAEEVFAALDRALGRLQARAALSADGGEDKRDAERYRWLRNVYRLCWHRHCLSPSAFGLGTLVKTPIELDMRIDAANQAKGDA